MSTYVPLVVDAESVIGSWTCVPPVGEMALGVPAFSRKPSAVLGVLSEIADEGDVGFGDVLLHATANARSPVAVHRKTFRVINRTPLKNWCYTEGSARASF